MDELAKKLEVLASKQKQNEEMSSFRANHHQTQMQKAYGGELSDYEQKPLVSVHSMSNFKREGLNVVDLLPVLTTKRKDEV